MSLSTVEIRIASANPSLVELQATGSPAIVQINMGPSGPAGTNGTNGGSTSAWKYKAKTNATSGYPGNGYLLWNNATQTSATSIIVSHLTDDDTDIELFLSFFVVNQKIFIQDRDDSSKNQVWLISGTPTVTGANTSTAYYTFPVTLVSSAGGAFTNNHSILFGQISVATNAVTSATTSDGTCALSVASLGSLGLVEGATGFQFGDVETAAGMVAFNFDNTRLSWESELPTQRSYGFNVLNLAQDVFLYIPNATGTLALTSSTTGVPDKLTNGTIAGTLTINSTTITYGTGAAAAHRTALGLTTLATTTAGTGVVTALGNNANGAGGFVTDSGTVANATNADYATIAGNATTANEVPLNGITGLGTSVATALAINIGSSGAMVTSNSTDTLTNKTLTSPAINSATLGTAATFNATSYTFGTGAAAAMNQSLGTSSVDSRISSLFSAPYNFVQDNFVGKAIVVSGYYGQMNWGIVGSASLSSDLGYYVAGYPGGTSISTNNNAFFLYLFGTSAANIAMVNDTVFDLVFNTSTSAMTVQNFFVGLRSFISATVETGRRGLSFEAGVDTNWQLLHETSAGVQTKIDTGKPALSNQTVRVTIKFVSATQTDMIIATSTSTTPVTVSATSGFSFTGFCGIGMWLKSTTAVSRILIPLRATLAWLSPTL
jgi:hypothetical protein